jgi:hypothetical protein
MQSGFGGNPLLVKTNNQDYNQSQNQRTQNQNSQSQNQTQALNSAHASNGGFSQPMSAGSNPLTALSADSTSSGSLSGYGGGEYDKSLNNIASPLLNPNLNMNNNQLLTIDGTNYAVHLLSTPMINSIASPNINSPHMTPYMSPGTINDMFYSNMAMELTGLGMAAGSPSIGIDYSQFQSPLLNNNININGTNTNNHNNGLLNSSSSNGGNGNVLSNMFSLDSLAEMTDDQLFATINMELTGSINPSRLNNSNFNNGNNFSSNWASTAPGASSNNNDSIGNSIFGSSSSLTSGASVASPFSLSASQTQSPFMFTLTEPESELENINIKTNDVAPSPAVFNPVTSTPSTEFEELGEFSFEDFDVPDQLDAIVQSMVGAPSPTKAAGGSTSTAAASPSSNPTSIADQSTSIPTTTVSIEKLEIIAQKKGATCLFPCRWPGCKKSTYLSYFRPFYSQTNKLTSFYFLSLHTAL